MTVFVSRHRMTECPGCGVHIRVAEDIGATTCPFCHDVLRQSVARRSSGSSGLGLFGRTSVVAGALFGLSVVAGCDDPLTVLPVYGAPADVISDQASDASVQPLYGAVADDIQVEAAPDPGPQPEYGMPADGQ